MLERSSYEGKGKSALADPMMAELLTEVKALRTSGASGAGKSAGISALAGWLVSGILLLLAIAGFALKVFGQ